jgi:putative RecB family exonuclease
MNKLRLSPSRVNDFSNCPLLYKYRIIDQLPEAPSLDAERGTLVHTVLHDLFESPAELRTVQTATDLLPTRWQEQLRSKPELASMITSEKEWLDRASSLLSTYFELENPTNFEPTYRELHLEQNLTENIYLHGYVDRLDVAPTGEVRIIDYKTGKSPKPGWEDKALFQLRVYALLYWKEHKVIPRLLQLIYLGDSNMLRNSPTEQELIATEKSLMKIAESINDAIESDTWLPRKSKLCDWCSFKSICPAHN